MSLNSTEEVNENATSVASLRPAFTIAGIGVHLPPEQAFTITGIRTSHAPVPLALAQPELSAQRRSAKQWQVRSSTGQ
jgi:hypothetical protein